MTDQSEDPMRTFTRALFAPDPDVALFGKDEPDEPDDKGTVTPEPEPTDDDHQFTRLFFNPTEGH